MAKLRHIIYPPTAPFLTRHLSLVGFLALVLVLLGAAYVGVRSFPQTNAYLALVITSIEKITGQLVGNAQSENAIEPRDQQTALPPTEAQTATSTDETTTSTPEATLAVEDVEELANTPLAPIANGRPRGTLQPGPARTTTYTATSTTGPTILPGGVPDLAVQIIESGIITEAGIFQSATSTGRGEQTGVVFEVKNMGTAVAGPWRFSAELPTTPGNFTSEIQEPLTPEEKIRYTIGFRLLRNEGPNFVRIIVDPSGTVIGDRERGNNSAATTVIRNYP